MNAMTTQCRALANLFAEIGQEGENPHEGGI
jgi:hypothetical protein